MEKKEMILFSIFLVVLFMGQLFIADRVLFGDDYLFATFAKEKLFFYYENAHPPLPVWTDIALTSLFGVTNRTVRLTSIIFATLTVALVYFTGKRFFNTRIAWFAALLLGISAYHIRASQMNSTSDGGMFTFFFLLTLYFLLSYFDKLEKKYLVFSGISLGATLWTRETGVLLLPIIMFSIFFYFYTNEKGHTIKKAKTPVLVIYGIGLLLFSIYPIIDLTLNEGDMLNTLFERTETAVIADQPTHGYLALSLYSVFKIVVWLGPLLLLLVLYWIYFIWKQKQWKEPKQAVFWITLIVVFLFYFTVTPPNLDRSRYVMVVLPVFALFSAQAVDTLVSRFSRGTVVALVVCTALFFCLFLWMNTYISIVSYEGYANPFHQLADGNIFFSVPLFTETDNSGMLFQFSIIVVAFVVSACLFALFLIFPKQAVLLMLFISCGTAYTLVLGEEYGLHWTSPNYSDGVKELIEYGNTIRLKEPIYLLKNYELVYYLGKNNPWYSDTQFITTYGIPDTDEAKIAAFAAELDASGGTVIFSDMPPMDKNGLLWKTINQQCVAEYTVVDKGIEIGWVWSC